MNTLEQVKALIGDKAGIPASDVQDDAWLGRSLDSRGPDQQFLDLDSADRLELQMEIEERFCIEISDAQAEKVEMGTPAGIAAYVREVKGHVIDETFGERGPFGQIIDTPAESVAEIPEDNSREYERGFTAGYAKARPLDPHKVYFGDGSDIDFPIPIDRDELMRRGLAENLGGAVMDVVMKLGFPTEDNPMGTEATHMLIPLDPRATEEDAGEAEPRQWVKFLRIERVEPFDQIHFDHPAADTPDWLMEACSLPSGDEGAIWADNGVLFVATPKGHEPVKPGQLIRVVPQLQVADDVLVDPEFLKAD